MSYLDIVEDRNEQFENRKIEKIVKELETSLQHHETYFLHIIIRHFCIDKLDKYIGINEKIADILLNDEHQYIQELPVYKDYKNVSGTLHDAITMYAGTLKKILIGNLPDSIWLPILQRFKSIFPKNLDEWSSKDIISDKTLGILQKLIQEDSAKMANKLEQTQNTVQKTLMTNLSTKPNIFSDQNKIFNKEGENLEYIHKKLLEILWKATFDDFIIDFFEQTDKEDILFSYQTENIIQKLIKKYNIINNEDQEKILDYLQRLYLIYKKIKKDE